VGSNKPVRIECEVIYVEPRILKARFLRILK